eukprot:GEMP01010355.1.p1 GENE.GEMP01010355.1~~GEMP01010355.1.p1  ORF type:complete len:233 (-),score=35.43 GEMP01010355.1:2605-3303(-)
MFEISCFSALSSFLMSLVASQLGSLKYKENRHIEKLSVPSPSEIASTIASTSASDASNADESDIADGDAQKKSQVKKAKRSPPPEAAFHPKIDGDWLEKARDLSILAFGENQCKKGRTAALIVNHNGQDQLVAFCNYSVRAELRSFHINYLAVEPKCRNLGYGRTLVRKLKELGKKKTKGAPQMDVICLSSLPSAVKFYAACGFKRCENIHVQGEDFIKDQVYMEHVIRRRR